MASIGPLIVPVRYYPWRAIGGALLIGAVVGWAATCSLDDSDGADARAESYERAADMWRETAQEWATRNAEARRTYSADSARWEAEVAEARAREAAATIRVREATARASAVATDLTARLDSTEARMFAEYEAERDSIDEATEEILDTYRSMLLATTAERDELRALLFGREQEITALRNENAGLRSAIDALHERIRGLERQGTLTRTVLLLGAGAVLADKVIS